MVTSTHAPSLYRLLRGLASLASLLEARKKFALTPLAECLVKRFTQFAASFAIMSGEEHYKAWGELLYSVQTGKPRLTCFMGCQSSTFVKA
ncbi:MAG: hypothetical protein U0894_18925 [Pirellulales bacterium]